MASEGNTAKKQRRSTPRKKFSLASIPSLDRRGESWVDEILAVIFFVLALFLLVSFLSYRYQSAAQIFDYERPQLNLMGPVGHRTGALLSGFLGWCAILSVLWAGWFALYFWNYEKPKSEKKEKTHSVSLIAVGFAGMLIFACVLTTIIFGAHTGGIIGDALASPLRSLFGTIGSGILSGILFLVAVALATRSTLAQTLTSFILAVGQTVHIFAVRIPGFVFRACALIFALLAQALKAVWLALFHSKGRPSPDFDEGPALPRPKRHGDEVPFVLSEEPRKQPITPAPEPKENKVYQVVVNRRNLPELSAKKDKKKPPKNSEPENEYVFPPLDLLTRGETAVEAEDDLELRRKSQVIESKLRDFNILGRVTHIHPGPVITLFEFEPAAGVKVGRIASLQEDLAMGLKASSVRIIAPIPKRGTVGIEVPNKHRDIVRLRDLLESEAFQSSESILGVPLGKDTSGDPIVTDIAVMPHLLMAGATGTGKSVCINAALVSLLYRCSPKQLGLILIDPKILELSVYEDIPHLKVPVVVDPRQARAVLQWAVNEMDRRYKLMQRFEVRSIDGYNRIASGEVKVEEVRERYAEDVIKLSDDKIIEEGDPSKMGEETENFGAEVLEPLPKIVIVIDELADLMLTVGRDIEELITRLAQKARASGIHLIVATQRPSVDVITGLIKANFPARLSFRVTSRIDSRTILDTGGAEKLLGRGDMLLMQPGAEALRRMHGAFVSDTEVKFVVKAVKKNGKPKFDQRIMNLCAKALEESEREMNGGASATEDNEYDALYDKAVELVVEKGQASTSMIQRVFRIGYNRAARMIETMERDGVIGPMDGVKPREVLLPNAGADE